MGIIAGVIDSAWFGVVYGCTNDSRQIISMNMIGVAVIGFLKSRQFVF